MSTHAHAVDDTALQDLRQLCRPPVTTRRCDAPRAGVDADGCASHAVTWLPELDRCQHHVPNEWLPIVNERMRLFTTVAQQLWSVVLEAVPPPEATTSPAI